MQELVLLSPEEAWKRLKTYKDAYYDSMAALYDGDHDKLRYTGKTDSFWKRTSGKCKVHVPICSDIASTSANLLFSSEPTYLINHNGESVNESEQQKRLEDILMKNNMANKLNEAAETCSAFGDVYMKLRWNTDIDHPLLDVVQPDCSWPEYLFGELRAVHFFTPIFIDYEKDVFIRTYECYQAGKITMAIYTGHADDLGKRESDTELEKLGYTAEIKVPIDTMIAVHIANVRPNRLFRASMMGRSDLDGLRDLCDSLDETYSSWMRDVRLAKARLIVPAEYLREMPQGMVDTLRSHGVYDFDTDVETYVSMNIDTDRAGVGITPSQFAIRSSEHAATCSDLIHNILEFAGYSPQTFGLDVNGSNASGTALSMRERKSALTANKKRGYWQSPLESILTSMIQIDRVLYKNSPIDAEDTVAVSFADSMGADSQSIASTAQLLYNAQSASAETRVRMQHPDWSEIDIAEEVDRIHKEFGMLDSPDMMMGDFDEPNKKDADNDSGTYSSAENSEDEETDNYEDGEE